MIYGIDTQYNKYSMQCTWPPNLWPTNCNRMDALVVNHNIHQQIQEAMQRRNCPLTVLIAMNYIIICNTFFWTNHLREDFLCSTASCRKCTTRVKESELERNERHKSFGDNFIPIKEKRPRRIRRRQCIARSVSGSNGITMAIYLWSWIIPPCLQIPFPNAGLLNLSSITLFWQMRLQLNPVHQ